MKTEEEPPVDLEIKEVKTEEEPPRAGSALSRPGRGEEGGEPNRLRGEMSPEELQEIWSSSRRTRAQRAVENTLAGVAADELTHQFGRSPALSKLVEKQKDRPTEGGELELNRNIKAITGSATATAVIRRRAGKPEPTYEAYEYGKAVARTVEGADDRLQAALAPGVAQPTVQGADSRFAAGVRAQEPIRRLKRELRARKRAAEHRKEVSQDDARRRLEREAVAGEPRLAVDAAWHVDDGVPELTYSAGSWECDLCGSVAPPDSEVCVGWSKGARCEGTYAANFRAWARSRPAKGQKRSRRTALESALRSSQWYCVRCWSGNLAFRHLCYKCSCARPEHDLPSSDEDDKVGRGSQSMGPTGFQKEEEARQGLHLRSKKKKRGGAKHKKKVGRRSGVAKRLHKVAHAAESASSRLRAGSHKAHKKGKKKKPKKKVYSWSVSRKIRNQTKRASNGNGWNLNQMAGAFATLMAFPVLKESEEVVAVTSEAIQDAISTTVETYQEIVTEGGNQLKMLIAAAGIALQVMMTWYLSSKVLNFWCRYGHGNTDKAHLVELRGEVTLWDVAGTKGLHRVRIAGRQAGCACRAFLSKGSCPHTQAALAALSALPSRPEQPVAVRRGQAALGQASPVASFSGCFQGLVGKAKQLTASSASANPPAQMSARASERDDGAFKRKVIRESLSLDTGSVEGRPVQNLLALPEYVHSSGDGDQANVVFLKDGEVFEWITNQFGKLSKGSKACIRAYSFDQPDVVEAVKSAASRGCDTYLVCDRSQASGKTKQQLQVLKELRSVGTKVKLASGLGVNQAYRSDGRSVRVGSRLQGLHHAKSVMIWCHPGDEVDMLVGSCNFTTSSKANKEVSVGISVSSGTELVRRWESAFEEAFENGSNIDQFETEQGSDRRRVGAASSAAEVQ